MKYNKIFIAFLEEASFTKELLAQGVTQLYKANYATKGIYYQSFVLLSTGIERLAKLCLILDYYIDSNGQLPTEKQIRNYGHEIPKLINSCEDISKKHSIGFHFKYKMDMDIKKSIIDLLGDFAKSSGRYSNINILTNQEDKSIDCIKQWFVNVDIPLYEKHVTKYKKLKIEKNADFIGNLLNSYASTSFISENNTEISDAVEASKRTGIWKAVSPYRQLYMLQIIRYLTEILRALGYKAMSINPGDIPFFSEIFGLFYNSNEYFRGRKTWDKL